MTNAQRFKQHQSAVQAKSGGNKPMAASGNRIIPKVQQLKAHEGQSTITANWQIVAVKEATAEAQYLQQQIQQLFKLTLPLHGETHPANGTAAISLTIDTNLNQAERYQLTISPSSIAIVGNDTAGIFYGIQRLLALMPIADHQTELSLPLVSIDDAPRYPWRGMHYDMAETSMV
ncbi:glycoside hydrolase family 20 zincin-like fold domain-containing protein [Alishewanella longhuensis]